jgi:ribonuclease HI/endonuclease/exonuclease/phosphatase family metal-dependent hydrolase
MAATLLMQWNAYGIRRRVAELKHYISTLENTPHVICLQETFLKPTDKTNFKLTGYNCERKDRENEQKGGVAILIRKGVKYTVINTPANMECIGVKLDMKHGQHLNIFSVYCPPNREKPLDSAAFTELLKLKNTIVMGDLNAKSAVWKSPKANKNGRVLEELIDENRCVCLNTGQGTYQKHQGGLSCLDLSIVSASLATKCNWSTINNTLGSDHQPTFITLNDTVTDEPTKPKWILNKADWTMFTDQCRRLINNSLVDDDTGRFHNNVINSMITAANTCIPKRKGNQRRKTKTVPYWDDGCTKAILNRNKTRNKFNSTGDMNDHIEYKKAKGIAQRTIKDSSRQYWQNYCSTLCDNTKLGSVWRMSQAMNGVQSQSVHRALTDRNGLVASSDQDKANLLAHTFAMGSSTASHTDTFKVHKNEAEKKFNIDAQTSANPPNKIHLNDSFSLHELYTAVRHVKNDSAPGQNEITYEMMKHLPRQSLKILLKLYNQIWASGRLPTDFKHSEIIAFPKPDKDHTNPACYRPISLTSALCKINEKMIVNRLSWYVETNNLLSNNQAGFRRGRCTTDHILRLQDAILKNIKTRGFVLGVFIDFEKAFDLVWKTGLLVKLQNLGVSGNMLHWIDGFLTDRTLQVRVGNDLSDIFRLENGTAQGSILSPLLFLIMINDFPPGPNNIETSLYADDSTVYKGGKNLKLLTKQIQNHLNTIDEWCDKWGFKINTNKTVAVVFTNKCKYIAPTLTMNGKPIAVNDKAKFLGMIFDQKLTWAAHIDYIIGKCNRRINLMRSISGATWGSDKKTLLHIYRTLIRPIIDYGAVAYDNASQTNKAKLDVIQSKALKICCGAMRGSSVAALQNECGEMPLAYRRLEYQIKNSVKIKTTPNHPGNDILLDHWTLHYGNFASGREPVAIKVKDYTDNNTENIEPQKHYSTPLWHLKELDIDLTIAQKIKKSEPPDQIKAIALEHIEVYNHCVRVYTDGSKIPDSGKTTSAFSVPEYGISFNARISDNLSIYTAELIAIKEAVKWIIKQEKEKPQNKEYAIFSDSKSSLESITSGHSKSRPNLLIDVIELLNNSNSKIHIVYIPSHVGIHGNETVDRLAKAALDHPDVDMHVSMETEESFKLVRKYINAKWQKAWDQTKSAQSYKQIEPNVSQNIKYTDRTRAKERLITRLRIGTCQLNQYLYKIDRHTDGLCTACQVPETIGHYLLQCTSSAVATAVMQTCRNIKLQPTLQNILSNTHTIDTIYKTNKRSL